GGRTLDKVRGRAPILAGALQATPDGGVVPAVRARREFPASGQLYCGFDVFSAGRGPARLARGGGGLWPRRGGGACRGGAHPNPIRPTSIGALSRIIQIPLDGQAPGDYELRLTVTDQLSGETRALVEAFSLAGAPRGQAAR